MDFDAMKTSVINALHQKVDTLQSTILQQEQSIDDYILMINSLAFALNLWVTSFDQSQTPISSQNLDYSREVLFIYNKNYNSLI